MAAVEPVVTGLGYELVGVEFGGGSGDGLLRVYIDTEDGITVDDCATVSESLSAALDVENPIRGAYTLEVSSPGINRPLFMRTDFERFVGEQVFVRMEQPLDGRRRFKGLLLQVEDGDILVEVDGESWRLPLAGVEEAHLIAQQ